MIEGTADRTAEREQLCPSGAAGVVRYAPWRPKARPRGT